MVKLTLIQGGTDNLFQNSIPMTDYVTSPGFYLDKDLGRFSLFAEGGFHFLSTYPALSNFTQDLGVDFIQPTGEKSALYFSLSGRGALYRDDYTDFNSLAINLYSAFKTYLTPTSIFQANYSLENKSFHASGFDYTSHALVDGRISAEKVQVLIVLYIPDPDPFGPGHDNVQRKIIVRTV